MAAIIWTGAIQNQTLRVVDLGVGSAPRLIVEQRQPPDAMGGMGWVPMDPIPRSVFEGILLASGVVH
jgi:hypothetical protein